MNRVIKIGTRGSKLALWQAFHVEDLLNKAGLASEIVIIDTKGDQVLDVSISKIGSKGVFTQELEDQLLDGRIDIAVHSAKDMQSNLADDFEIIAFTERDLYPLFDLCGRAIPMSAQTDQSIGGITMWVPAAMTEVVGLLIALRNVMRLSAAGRWGVKPRGQTDSPAAK